MVATTKLVDGEAVAPSTQKPPEAGSSGRMQLAQVLAFVALVATLVGALGPAERVRDTYSWPPDTLPETSPSRVWYTPLLLIRHQPQAVSADIPCSLPPALGDAERPLLVLATARFPERSTGLALRRTGRRLVFGIGDDVLARIDFRPVPSTAGECSYRLLLGDGRWSIEGGPERVALGGSLEAMPVVTGLFTGLDLRSGPPLQIHVTTAAHTTQTTLRQTLAWTLALVCLVTALLLVATERRPRPWRATRGVGRRAFANAHPADAVVAIVLLGWWVLSPAFWDDGWIVARGRMFSASGGFSHYYSLWGTNLPSDYWLEWMQHWLAESSLLVLRVPALLCLAVAWVLCRWILARVQALSVGESRAALWALASAFLVGALAWGMTLRPEPVTALLVTGVMACTVRFLERETAAPLAAIAVLIPLALTGHHAAVVAFAPLLVVAPTLFRWARSWIAAASTIVAASIALFAVLLFVSSDLEQRRAEAQLTATAIGVSWRNEMLRYVLLEGAPFGTPLRRASVALIAIAVLAFVLRRRPSKRRMLDLPASALAVALLLLIAAPSKQPYHFGALLGLAALAVASETARFRDEIYRKRGWEPRALIAIGAGTLAIAWSWSPRHGWIPSDLRTLDWTLGFERSLPLSSLAIGLPVALFAGAALIALARGRGVDIEQAQWSVASWTAPVLALPLILFTVAVFAADAAKTDSWTLTRQNLATLGGVDAGCGLADDLVVPVSGSALALSAVIARDTQTVPAWVPPTPVPGLPRFGLRPAEGLAARSPWFQLPNARKIGLYVTGTLASSDRLGLEWGRLRGSEVTSLGSRGVSRESFEEARSTLPWRFLAASELPAPHPRADAVRVTLRSDVAPGAAVAVTAPYTYSSEKLVRRLSRSGPPSLVFPNLVTYFPCARLPRLSGGIVEAPGQILVPRDSRSPLRYPGESPFEGVLDLYRLERLPLADSPNPPRDFVVFGIDRRIPGAVMAPAARTATTS